ncbi:hypothetical protein KAH27_05030 [bacterium]|nr:hypothetical protein [bacterium]
MKTKKTCMMIVITLLLTVSVNVLAKAAEIKKEKSECCGQKTVQKVEKKAEILKDGDIPLSKVPKKIKAVAKKAVKGIKLSEAEIEDGNYELEGTVGQDKYEVKITPEGKLISVNADSKKDDDLLIEVDDENPVSGD